MPGVFPPVLIHVRNGIVRYDELHVDGGVTTPVFITPMIAGIKPVGLSQLRGANLYMIVNGQLAQAPTTTPVNTLDLLASSFSAAMTYKTRAAILDAIGFSREFNIHFRLTEIPVDYPITSFVDFRPASMHSLFNYAANCALENLVWLTPQQSIEHNTHPHPVSAAEVPACPATGDAAE